MYSAFFEHKLVFIVKSEDFSINTIDIFGTMCYTLFTLRKYKKGFPPRHPKGCVLKKE